MEAFLYILRSKKTGRNYVGACRDLDIRLSQHNHPGINPSRVTRGGGPWELIYSQRFDTVAEALRAERYVKRMKTRKFIEKLISGEYKLPEFDK